MEYKKKLFWWDFIRLPLFYTIYFLRLKTDIFGPVNPFTSEVASLSYDVQKNMAVHWCIGQGIEYFGSNSGHIWGDFLYLITGNINYWVIAFITIPLIVLMDYLWAYRNKEWAGNIRIYNWFILITAYFIWTVFFPLDKRYDYYVFNFICEYFHFGAWIILLSIFVISMMWIKFLISGYFIYKECYDKKKKIYPWIPMFLSLGIPGTGQFAKKEIKKGLLFISLAPLVWWGGLYAFYIPTIILWGYSAYDARRVRNIS